jgi:ABC-2 type transport system permease protein
MRMLNGLLKLSWIETKVFLREPLGVLGSLAMPVIIFMVFGRAMRGGPRDAAALARLPFNLTTLSALLIALGAVQSLIAIMAIYREGGILKRLRATPLSSVTILGAHVLVKLVFTVVGLALLILAGKRVLPGALPVNLVSFTAAVLLSTLSILSLGFVLASVVPTARFAQPLGAAILYPMLAVSGLFIPLERLPSGLRALASLLPTTHAVTLMNGVWSGSGWGAHWGSVGALMLTFAICITLSARWFRWE